MRETYLELPDRIARNFTEIDSDIMIDLRNTNKEYVRIQKQLSELFQELTQRIRFTVSKLKVNKLTV